MIGIIGAMPEEVESLKCIMEEKEENTVGNIKFSRGKIHGKDVVCAVSGIGKVFSAVTTQTMILTYKPDLILNTGVAGGLTDTLNILDVVVGVHAVQYDVDTTAFGDELGFISDLKMTRLPCDEKIVSALCESAEELNVNYYRGVIATGDRFLTDKNDKKFLNETFNAYACEMEGGSIGQVCVANGVPYGIIRSVSDGEGSDQMDYNEFKVEAAQISTQITELFIKKYK